MYVSERLTVPGEEPKRQVRVGHSAFAAHTQESHRQNSNLAYTTICLDPHETRAQTSIGCAWVSRISTRLIKWGGVANGSPGGNFEFLKKYDTQLLPLGALAERYFEEDPNTCLIKLRQFAELLAQQLAARMGLFTSSDEPFADLLQRLKAERAMPREAGDLFHQLRILGNQAAHAHRDDHATALTGLKLARQLAIWFHTTFGGDTKFKPGPFVSPTSPTDASAELRAEIERLNTTLQSSQSDTERARSEAEQHAGEKETAQETARREAAERALWEQLAQEAETHKVALAAETAAGSRSCHYFRSYHF